LQQYPCHDRIERDRHTRDLVYQCLYTPAVWAFTRFTSRPIVQLSMPLIRYGGPSLWQAVTNYIQTSLVTCTQFRLFIREHTNPSDTNFALTGRQWSYMSILVILQQTVAKWRCFKLRAILFWSTRYIQTSFYHTVQSIFLYLQPLMRDSGEWRT